MSPWVKSAATLLAGFFLGVAATSLVIHDSLERNSRDMRDAGAILSHLSKKLDLTDDQKDKVAALLKKELPKRDALRQQKMEQFKAQRDSFNRQLRVILDPDQQKKFDDMLAKWEEHEKNEGHLFGCSGPPAPARAVTGK